MSGFSSSNFETSFGSKGNFKSPTLNSEKYFSYCDARLMLFLAGCIAEAIAYRKQRVSLFITFTIAFLSASSFGVGMYELPPIGLYLARRTVVEKTLLKTKLL